MEDIKALLSEEIKSEIEALSSLKAGSDEKAKAIKGVTELYKVKIEEEESEAERENKLAQQELEKDKYYLESQTRDDERVLKEAQFKDSKKDRWINLGLQAALAVGGWIAYDIWHRRGLRFELEGTVTSPWTRNLISKMMPKK